MLKDFKGFGVQDYDPNVEEKRNIYVGGSDVPTILGINKYKTQFQLAKEKIGLEKPEFVSNPYVKFGNVLEPQIRDYINAINQKNFVVDTYIDEEKHIRSNVDGIDKEEKILLEIKTHGANPTWKVYEAQMQLYMKQTGAEVGWLATYRRPEDFDVEFDADRLDITAIERDEKYISQILEAIDTFWIRCEFLKDDPEMDEAEFMTEGTKTDSLVRKIKSLAPKVIEAQNFLKSFKELQNDLYAEMTEGNVKDLDIGRLSFTRVLPSASRRFDSKSFKKDHADLYEEYQKETKRKGYIKMTVQEDDNESKAE